MTNKEHMQQIAQDVLRTYKNTCQAYIGASDALTAMQKTLGDYLQLREAEHDKQWVGLTDKDIDECYFAARQPDFDVWEFAAEIEEVLKKKNT